MVVLAVAAAGGVGWASTLTLVDDETQVLSVVLRTKMVCEPAETPAKVPDA